MWSPSGRHKLVLGLACVCLALLFLLQHRMTAHEIPVAKTLSPSLDRIAALRIELASLRNKLATQSNSAQQNGALDTNAKEAELRTQLQQHLDTMARDKAALTEVEQVLSKLNQKDAEAKAQVKQLLDVAHAMPPAQPVVAPPAPAAQPPPVHQANPPAPVATHKQGGDETYFEHHFHKTCEHVRQHELKFWGKDHTRRLGEKRQPVELLVGIISFWTNREKRDAIRNTWVQLGKRLPPGITVKFEFILGMGQWSSQEWRELQAEQAEKDDLVLLAHTEDYDLLNQKTHKWFQRSICFYIPTYVVKVDDDTYVRFTKFYEELKKLAPHDLYIGDIYENIGAGGNDDKEHKVQEYMPFATGNMYVISGELIEWLAKCPAPLRYYNGEDVSVGQWLSPLELNVIDEERFIPYGPDVGAWMEHGCRADMLSQHRIDPAMMERYYQNEIAGALPCEGVH